MFFARVVALATSMVLLAATAMKWHAVAHTVLAGGWRNNPVLVAVQLVVEPSLALWLMSGYFAAHAAGVAACVFVVFAFVSLHSAIDGATSCGCFGTAAVNPWLTTSCDAAMNQSKPCAVGDQFVIFVELEGVSSAKSGNGFTWTGINTHSEYKVAQESELQTFLVEAKAGTE